MSGLSVGFLVGSNQSECGYCSSGEIESSCSFGMWMYSMNVEQYQLMIDRGWRRSGKYLYKPDIPGTCCPPYTIRLACDLFIPSKSQSKVLKKIRKYLMNGGNLTKFSLKEGEKAMIVPELVGTTAEIPAFTGMDIGIVENSKTENSDVPMETDHAPTAAKTLSILNRNAGISSLIDAVETLAPGFKHSIKVELDPSVFSDDVYNLYVKYQVAIHRDSKEELTVNKFTQFLVDSPLRSSGSDNQYGSFHQKYYIDNVLIAVAFLDILPNCVSSVYFIYDPDFGDLSLGTYSALREIATTYRLSLKYPSLKYYYLGYYIHSCPKMAYKARYAPSELLCPYTFNWHPASEAIPLLEQVKSSILSDSSNPTCTRKIPLPYADAPKQTVSVESLSKVKIVESNMILRLSAYIHNKELMAKLYTLIERSGPVILDNLALFYK